MVPSKDSVDGSPYKSGKGGDRNNNPKFKPKYPVWSQAANLNRSRDLNSSRNG